MERDVEGPQCEVDKMLRSFLSDCMVKEGRMMDNMRRFFDVGDSRILPIRNGEWSANGIDSSRTKEHHTFLSTTP